MGLLLDFFFFAVCFAGDDFLLEDLLELLRRLAVELLVDFRADLEAGFRVDLLWDFFVVVFFFAMVVRIGANYCTAPAGDFFRWFWLFNKAKSTKLGRNIGLFLRKVLIFCELIVSQGLDRV